MISALGAATIGCHAAAVTLAISVPTVIDASRGTLTAERCDRRLEWWSRALLSRVRVHLEVFGVNALHEDSGPFVVVSNHQSHYDIPCLYQALPLRLRMAAKAELFEIPIWGRALSASGFVAVERSSPRRAVQALKLAGARMRREQFSLFVAPEGTRSADGEVGVFRRGAFELARLTEARILPVAIDGSMGIHRKSAWRVGAGQGVTVRVLSPVEVGKRSSDVLAAEVREQIVEALASHQIRDV